MAPVRGPMTLAMANDGAGFFVDGASAGDLAALAAIVRALPDAVLVIDAGATVLWANTAAERLFGIPAAEAIGANGLDFIHPDDFQLAALALTSVQGQGRGQPARAPRSRGPTAGASSR